MSQGSLTIANQSFPAFRTALNSAFQAINTTQSGTSRPSGAVAGTLWLDTTNANPTLKFYDGTSDISFATLNYTAHTVDWLDSSVTITGLSTSATGTVLTLTDTAHTTSVNMICGNNTALRFNELTVNGSNYIGLKAPASLSADLTFTLPSVDGTAGQFIKTDGAGNLSFATAGLTGATSTATGTVLTLSDTQNIASVNVILDNEKELRFRENTTNGTNYVGFKAPANLTVDKTYTLPSADGTSGQVLQTNGSGVLSFAGVSASAGQVIQVVSTTLTTATSTAATGATDIAGLSVTITPSASANKILVLYKIQYSNSSGSNAVINLVRNGTNIGMGASGQGGDDCTISICVANSNYYQSFEAGGSFLDSPSSTSALTYKFQTTSGDGAGPFYFNRTTRNGASDANGISTITVMEIKG